MMPMSEYRRKKQAARTAAVDKYCSRKLMSTLGWADLTEVDFSHFLTDSQEEYLGTLSEAYQCFRNLAVTESPSDVETDVDSVFSAAGSVSSVSSTSSVRSASRYRQRYGRGGRVYVDRTFTAEDKEEFDKSQQSWLSENPVLEERLKYDTRALEDEKSVPLDEYDIAYKSILYFANLSQIVYRARLLPSRPPHSTLMLNGIRLSTGSLSSPHSARPVLSPSSSKQAITTFQTPK
jgi:hypothetical protein